MMKLEELPTSSNLFDCREDVSPLPCKQCAFSSHVLASLIRHKKTGCGNKVDNSNLLLEAYKCRNCKFVSCSCITMTRHETKCASSTNSTPLWICSHCEFTISYKTLNLDKFECRGEECNSTYASLEELKQHAAFVHLPDECLIHFFTNDGVRGKTKDHSEIHRSYKITRVNNVQVFVSECEVECQRREESSMHMIEQTETQDRKRFKCQECPYKSASGSDLLEHQISKHTPTENIKWLECRSCSYKGKTKRALHKHEIRQHRPSENVVWFECKECPYKSKARQQFMLHKICKHTPGENIKWFQCEECEYKAKTKTLLRRHKINKHTPREHIKWFECQECDFQTIRKDRLQLHKRKKHAPTENSQSVVAADIKTDGFGA